MLILMPPQTCFHAACEVAERFSFLLAGAAVVVLDDERAVPATQNHGHVLVCMSIVRVSNWTLVYGLLSSASGEFALVNLLVFESVVYEVQGPAALDFLPAPKR
jgi:hypothetical protein